MRTAMALAGLALVLGGLTTACGDDDSDDAKGNDRDGKGGGSSATVSTERFCSKFNSLYTEALAGVDRTDTAAAIRGVKKWAEGMDDLGTPKEMPADVKEGFDVFIDAIEDLDDDASPQELQRLGRDLPKDDQQAGEKFGDWTKENCPVDGESLSPPAASPSTTSPSAG